MPPMPTCSRSRSLELQLISLRPKPYTLQPSKHCHGDKTLHMPTTTISVLFSSKTPAIIGDRGIGS